MDFFSEFEDTLYENRRKNKLIEKVHTASFVPSKRLFTLALFLWFARFSTLFPTLLLMSWPQCVVLCSNSLSNFDVCTFSSTKSSLKIFNPYKKREDHIIWRDHQTSDDPSSSPK